MRIVAREVFLAMPAGTVYAKYSPHVFGDLCIKCDTVTHGGKAIDWWYVDFTSIESADTEEWLERSECAMKGESVPMDFTTESRDGLYDADQLFAVYERRDVENLTARLAEAYCAFRATSA